MLSRHPSFLEWRIGKRRVSVDSLMAISWPNARKFHEGYLLQEAAVLRPGSRCDTLNLINGEKFGTLFKEGSVSSNSELPLHYGELGVQPTRQDEEI
jgi:hypothetical protein